MSLKYNPFRPNNLIHPGMFKGRAQELLGIEKILFQTKHGNPQHFVIEGERGIGKSSLMLYIEHLAKGALPFVQDPKFRASFLVVPVELTANMTALDVVVTLATKFREQVDKNSELKSAAKKAWEFLSKWEVLGVRYHGPGAQMESEPFPVLDKFCETVADFLKGAASQASSATRVDGVILLIDEADKPDPSARLGEIIKLLTEKMTRLDCENLAVAMAGLPVVLEKLKASHESSPRLFQIFTLGPLSEEDSAAVVDACIRDANSKNKDQTTIDQDARKQLCALSEGYPHFIQQFGYSAFDADFDGSLSTVDVEEGAYGKNGALKQLGRKFFQEMFFDQVGSDDYRKVLRVMAENSDQWVTRSHIIQSSGLKEHTVNNAIQALKGRNIIVVNDTIKGSYRLPTKSFAAWIKALSNAPSSLPLFDEQPASSSEK
ncbi:ATP-binding protein [Bdellovibrionota bacterium FG-1]